MDVAEKIPVAQAARRKPLGRRLAPFRSKRETSTSHRVARTGDPS